ncbi:hypothetical protein JL722_6768 [Aureococcus anophagefferens]|nr:hypothetical protein JL722_6768 [Aureococcus anophagefferens]
MELSETLPKDYEERMVSASVDCAGGKGDGDACHAVGEFFSRKDDAAALAHLEKACDGGDAASCYVLGGYFLRRARRTTAKAREFLEIACDDGHAPACHNLAVMMKNGDVGVPRDAKLFDGAARTLALLRGRRGVRVA